jgi:endonuclease-8
VAGSPLASMSWRSLGNVYKSELLFLHNLAPLTPVAAVSDAALHAIFTQGRALLQANLGGWPRTTTHDRRLGDGGDVPRLYVYGRAGQPCLRCGTHVTRAYLGKHRRSTYACPTCQPITGPSPTPQPP